MTLAYEVDGRHRRAAVWAPQPLERRDRWPLVLFLHAYEERGDDFEHLTVGIGPTLERHPDLYPAIVVLPQCPRDLVWVAIDRPWAAGLGSAEPHIDAVLAAALDRLPVDPARVALTGASMGGFGTFLYGARNPNRFRALGPVCGGGNTDDAEALATQRIWAVHGADDDVVPVTESRTMVDSIRNVDGDGTVRFTEVARAGHAVWDATYANPEFAAFLVGSTE